jgi:hypothetical protein
MTPYLDQQINENYLQMREYNSEKKSEIKGKSVHK